MFKRDIRVRLTGDEIPKWQERVRSMKAESPMLRLALSLTKGLMIIAAPVAIPARLIGLALTLLNTVTFGIPRVLLIYPYQLMALGLLMTSTYWESLTPLRPLLMILAVPFIPLGITLASLIPMADPDAREDQLMLWELWPLSSLRLRWVGIIG